MIAIHQKVMTTLLECRHHEVEFEIAKHAIMKQYNITEEQFIKIVNFMAELPEAR